MHSALSHMQSLTGCFGSIIAMFNQTGWLTLTLSYARSSQESLSLRKG